MNLEEYLTDLWGKKKRDYTKEELEKYKRYVQEWEYLKRCDRNGFVPWHISNGQGDPFSIEEWVDRPYLHNFKGTNY